jgi:hypothetical protein
VICPRGEIIIPEKQWTDGLKGRREKTARRYKYSYILIPWLHPGSSPAGPKHPIAIKIAIKSGFLYIPLLLLTLSGIISISILQSLRICGVWWLRLLLSCAEVQDAEEDRTKEYNQPLTLCLKEQVLRVVEILDPSFI